MFLAEQGYELTENIFYHDNQSAPTRKKWSGILRSEVPAHQHSLFFHAGPFRVQRHFRCLLSHVRDACQLLYKASSRQFASEITGRLSRSLSCEYAHKISATSIRGASRIRYWRKFDLELVDRRSRCRARQKCPNRWRSHLRVNSQKGPQVGTSDYSFFLINPIVRTV